MSTLAPVRFRGTPLALTAAVGEPPGSYRVCFDPAAGVPPEVDAVAVAADPLLRLHLPRTTPPGTYEGRLIVGDRERAALITVDPEVFLRLLPERLILEASAGDQLQIDLTLLNLGNVAVELRGAYAFGMFDVGGTERAIGKMVVDGGYEGKRRVDVFADAIADEHGGVVRVKVESGAGEIAPGETRDLSVRFHVPDHVRPGRTYWGTWPIHNMRYYVRITARAGDSLHGAKS